MNARGPFFPLLFRHGATGDLETVCLPLPLLKLSTGHFRLPPNFNHALTSLTSPHPAHRDLAGPRASCRPLTSFSTLALRRAFRLDDHHAIPSSSSHRRRRRCPAASSPLRPSPSVLVRPNPPQPCLRNRCLSLTSIATSSSTLRPPATSTASM